MVKVTVYHAEGGVDLRNYFAFDEITARSSRSGATSYLFTDGGDPYTASAFARQSAAGDWQNELLLGRSVAQANGATGFLPDIVLSGYVGDVAIDAFAVGSMTDHLPANRLLKAIFSGRDTLVGSSGDDVLFGFTGHDRLQGGNGNDHLFGGGGSDTISGGLGIDVVDGGDGDDILRVGLGDGSRSPQLLHGGAGNDFIYYSDNSEFDAFGDSGSDTFYVDGFIDGFAPNVRDFVSGQDRVQIDPDMFTALAGGYSSDNFINSSRAQDANDYLLFSGGSLAYDPDGNGPKSAKYIFGLATSNDVLKWDDIVVQHSSAFADAAVPASASVHHNAEELDQLVGSGLIV